jgi:hypothetical protein
MVDKLLEFLQTILGKTLLGLVLFFGLGIGAVLIYDDCVCTESEKDLLYIAMDQGDNWTRLDIIQWKLESARTEKIRLENYIEIEQRGDMTASQEARLKELCNQIGRYEQEKQALLKKLQYKGR